MKTLILFEMAILEGGGLLTLRYSPAAQTPPSGATPGPTIETPWQYTLFKLGLKRSIAVLILLTLLLTAEETGLGTAAVLFGGLTALGYVLAAIGTLGPALQQGSQSLLAS